MGFAIPRGVVHLVTAANSVAFLLFHVEHESGTEWFWRWRIVGDYPLPYLHWREGSAILPRVVLHSEIPLCEIRVEWRPLPDEPWRQAALHLPAICTADFRVVAKRDFAAPRGFRAMAEVAGMVSCYAFGELFLTAGSEFFVEGRSDGPFADNVLLAPGDFVSEDDMVRIENVSVSSGGLVPAPAEETARLSVAAGAELRKLFARPYRPGPSEIKLELLKHHG